MDLERFPHSLSVCVFVFEHEEIHFSSSFLSVVISLTYHESKHSFKYHIDNVYNEIISSVTSIPLKILKKRVLCLCLFRVYKSTRKKEYFRKYRKRTNADTHACMHVHTRTDTSVCRQDVSPSILIILSYNIFCRS